MKTIFALVMLITAFGCDDGSARMQQISEKDRQAAKEASRQPTHEPVKPKTHWDPITQKQVPD